MMCARIDAGGMAESELKPRVIEHRHTQGGLLIRICC
jgi:hypothetical protein